MPPRALAAATEAAPAAPTRRLWFVAATVLVAAAAAQAWLGAAGDVSWMITINEKWLDGGRPYVDFVETNPPASILIYMPAVALARWLGASPEAMVAASGLVAAAAALAFAAAIARRAGLLAEAGALSLGLALAALVLVPGRAFAERDFFAALCGLPYVALSAARAARAPVGAGAALSAGLGAGAMIAIKPVYALALVAAAPSLMRRGGVAAASRASEHYAAAAVVVAYAASTAWLFPVYGADVLPAVAAAYLPVRETALRLVANAGVAAWIALALALAAIAGRDLKRPLVAAPALASLGALAAYFVQGKGWLYHAYPALAFLVLALAAAVAARPPPPRRLLVAAGAAAAAALATLLLHWPALSAAVGAALAASAILPATRGDRERRGGGAAALGEAAAAALLVAVFAFYAPPRDWPDAAFVNAVADLSEHPRLASVAEGLGIGFPLVREVGGVWAQRTQGMLLTAGARRLMAEHPGDRALAERLAPIIARDRDMVVEDILRNRPDGVLVSDVGAGFHAWALSDPKIAQALADYRPQARTAGTSSVVELYVRKDAPALRPTLSQVGE
jgi:hypothetical protein